MKTTYVELPLEGFKPCISAKAVAKTLYVELPPEDLIKPYVLVKAIVKALHPEKTEGLKGLECIQGRLLDIVDTPPVKDISLDFGAEYDSFWKSPFVSAVEHSELPPQLELPIPKVEFTQDFLLKDFVDGNIPKFRLPASYITDEERKELEPLLDRLPPLTYPMTEPAISRFLDAYMALPERPSWIPTFITSDTIKVRLEEQYAATDEHNKAVRQAIEEGTLSACSMGRVPTRSLSIDTLILRSSAVEYLKRCNLAVNEELSRQEGIYTASGSRVFNKKKTDKTWTPDEVVALRATLDTIDPKTQKKFTRRELATQMGLSPCRITQLLNEPKVKRKEDKQQWKDELNQVKKSFRAKLGNG